LRGTPLITVASACVSTGCVWVEFSWRCSHIWWTRTELSNRWRKHSNYLVYLAG